MTKTKDAVDLDAILAELGQFGRYQIQNYCLILLPIMFSAVYNSQYIFAAGEIAYRCKVPECESSPPEFETDSWGPWALPGSGRCERFEPLDGECSANSFHPNETLRCSQWVYQTNHTIVATFDLACREWKRTLVGTVHSAGVFAALPITAYVSDTFGRRTAFILTSVAAAVMGVARSFSVNYPMYIALEFIEATVGSGVYSSGFILALEMVGLNRRVLGGNIISCTFAIGQVVVALAAWALPYWRTLTLVIYAPSFLFILYYFLIEESVRWLLSKGNKKEAARIIFKAAAINKKKLSPEAIKMLTEDAHLENEVNQATITPSEHVKTTSLAMQVLRSKTIMTRLIICSFWWITLTFVYYGLSINSVSLAGNSYVNYILTSLVEIPGYGLSVITLDRFGRKSSIMTAFFVCAASLISLPFVPNSLVWLQTTLNMVGKLCISMAFSSIYIYTSELFPTQARHSLLGFCSMMGRIGSIVAPQTPLLMSVMESLPYLLFGVMACASGLLMLLTPETLHIRLPDTVKQAENISVAPRSKRPTDIIVDYTTAGSAVIPAACVEGGEPELGKKMVDGGDSGEGRRLSSTSNSEPIDLDYVLVNELGEFGRFQVYSLVLVSIPIIMSAFFSEFVFSAGAIPHRCRVPECGENERRVPFEPHWLPNAIPPSGSGFASCERFAPAGLDNGSLDYCPAALFRRDTIGCDGFVYARDNTVVYDFDLGCQEWLRALAGTFSSVGTLLVLPIIGYISDTFGRRVALVISGANMALWGLLRAFSVNYPMYLALQLIQSTLGGGVFSAAYIFATEFVGPKYRVLTSATCASMFAVGQIVLASVAWLVEPWRYMLMALHIPCFLLILYYWITSESVRWLLSKQKFEQARSVLERVARLNKKKISEKTMDTLLRPAEIEEKVERPGVFITIIKSPTLLRRVCTTPIWWITTTFVYYGLSINSTSLSDTMHLNYILTCAIEIPGNYFSVLILDRIGRKATLSSCFFFSAACNIAFAFIPDDQTILRLVVFLLGKFGISVVFTALYLYTSELYPTEYRHSLLAFSSMVGRVGSITAPLTPVLMDYWPGLPSALFGVMGCLSGVLVLTQPETLGAKMPDTLAEAERIGQPHSKG